MDNKAKDDTLTDSEIAERMDRALRRSFEMPHKPHQGAPKASKGKIRPVAESRVRKSRRGS